MLRKHHDIVRFTKVKTSDKENPQGTGIQDQKESPWDKSVGDVLEDLRRMDVKGSDRRR